MLLEFQDCVSLETSPSSSLENTSLEADASGPGTGGLVG
jgi:hypothetical protein